jgi:hypothetical protein
LLIAMLTASWIVRFHGSPATAPMFSTSHTGMCGRQTHRAMSDGQRGQGSQHGSGGTSGCGSATLCGADVIDDTQNEKIMRQRTRRELARRRAARPRGAALGSRLPWRSQRQIMRVGDLPCRLSPSWAEGASCPIAANRQRRLARLLAKLDIDRWRLRNGL